MVHTAQTPPATAHTEPAARTESSAPIERPPTPLQPPPIPAEVPPIPAEVAPIPAEVPHTPAEVSPTLIEAPPTTGEHPGQTQFPLQADPEQEADDPSDDADSAYGSSVAGSNSASLTSSITKYRWENGRRYHAYKEGEYVMPNDESEQDRLDLQHQIYRLCLDGWLYRSPIKEPQKVLDLGTGTGIWAIEFADEYPGAVVIGTDLSPIQPSYVPPNLSFYVDDFEQPWEFGDGGSFDFIHWRSLFASTANWSRLYDQAMANLKPGGWLEVQEYHTDVYGDDETYERAPWVQHWCKVMNDASVRFGKNYNVADKHKGWMEEAGFLDVREEVYKVPVGPWTKDPKLKELGRFERVHMVETVEPHGLALFTRVLGYTTDEARIVFENAKKELSDKSLHLYTVYRFIYGRKAGGSTPAVD